MRVVGLDLSLSATGVADERGTRIVQLPWRFPTHASENDRCERLLSLSSSILDWCRGTPGWVPSVEADLVAIEGYSFNSKFSREPLAELAGLVKTGLYSDHIPYVIVAPQIRAKYATGKGNAGKSDVHAAAVHRAGVVMTPDEADAFWIRALVLDKLGHPVVLVPEKNREALKTLELPLGGLA